jgi:NAD(P)-dependent dehydrogenase (short-subunit alcohol dehydrogenase family)
MKVNYLGTRRLTERLLPRMREGSAIVSVSSNGGMGWSQRMPVLMEILHIPSFNDAIDWCESHAGQVREGYALSKELIIVWTMLMGMSLIKNGIRINCTQPGPTQTPMMNEFESATPKAILDGNLKPIGRRSTPDEQANALIFLNSAAASYINGVSLPVDGGFIGGIATGQIDMLAILREAGLKV